jgi:DNA-binding XRE family transcriptional regulator
MKEKKRDTLTSEEYWKWRSLIEELTHNKTKLLLEQKRYDIMGLQIQIEKMKQEMFREKINLAKATYARSERDYGEYKIELEKKLGRSLNNCAIDDITYKISDLNNKEE